MTRITRMGTDFTKGGSLVRTHALGASSLPRNLFFIRDIRDIRGSNYFFQVEPLLPAGYYTSPEVVQSDSGGSLDRFC